MESVHSPLLQKSLRKWASLVIPSRSQRRAELVLRASSWAKIRCRPKWLKPQTITGRGGLRREARAGGCRIEDPADLGDRRRVAGCQPEHHVADHLTVALDHEA